MSTETFSNFEQWHSYGKEYIENEKLLKYLEITHINIRSIKKHWNELLLHLTETNMRVDVLLLTEIGVNKDMCNTFIIPGYTFFSTCCKNRGGGGVLVSLKNNWKSEELPLPFETAESIAVSISCRHNTLVVWALNRPPSGIVNDFLTEFEFLLKKFDYTTNLTIAGDLVNIDTLTLSKTGVSDYLD